MKRNSVSIELISLIIAGLMALTGVSTKAQESGWQEIPPIRPIIQYLDIEFSSRDSGMFSTHTGELFRTINGGINWTRIVYPPSLHIQINQIHTLSDGSWIICAVTGIAYSSDFGESWTTINKDPFDTSILTDCSFINEKVGVVSDNDARVWYTKDGGVSWSTLDVDIDPRDVPRYVSMSSSGAIAIASGLGKIFVTTDEGATYLADSCQGVAWNGMQFVDDTTIVAVGYNRESDASIVFRSENCGVTWDSTTVDASSGAFDIDFINHNTGLLVGFADGQIFRTDDGGRTWSRQYTVTDSTLGLNKVTMVDDSVAYVLGNRIMLKTTTGGWTTTGVEHAGNEPYSKPVFSAYPNPASSVLTIQFFDTSINGIAHLSVGSANGEVALDAITPVRNGCANVNLSSLSPGVFMIRLFHNNSVTTKVIQVIR